MMPGNSPQDTVEQALADWQRQAEAAMRTGDNAAVAYGSKAIPDHVRAYLDEKLPQARSLYWLGEYFSQARAMATYPPGFHAPHLAYLAYNGAGITAAEHVQNHLFDFSCPLCKTQHQVVVLSSEWGVNLNSGDARGRFSAHCSGCGREFAGGFED